jgi:N6-L-threonylcarbamoyladenine synthase
MIISCTQGGNMLTLGIETSCDETAAAIAENGRKILSSVVSSQLDLHRKFGGVVPEIASRAHLELIFPVIEECLDSAGKTLEDIDAVAATAGPGLAGALLVGLSAAKSLCFAMNKPFIAVNHIEAHIYSAFMEYDVRLPAVGLAVSGGHTDLMLVENVGAYRLLGRTRDDAAGEAFDKAAKMLGLGYPGGPAVEKAAESGDPHYVHFPRPLMPGTWDFSFSGLKTALLYHIRDCGAENINGIAASFQAAAVVPLVYKTFKAAEQYSVNSIIIAGGVAGNSLLRKLMKDKADAKGFNLYIPSMKMCTDNAAMVAGLGGVKLKEGEAFPLSTTADPGWTIGEQIRC